jgi:hypothetical protein
MKCKKEKKNESCGKERNMHGSRRVQKKRDPMMNLESEQK